MTAPLHACRHTRPLTFASPEERADFSRWPGQQERIRRLHAAMLRIADLSARGGECAGSVKKACAQAECEGAGWGAKYLRKLYDRWKAARDWRILLDRRLNPEARDPALPAEFIAFIGEKFSADQRTNMGAWRLIIRQWLDWWHTGDPRFAIRGCVDSAGNPACPAPGRNPRHPDGWSYEALNAHRPARAAIAVVREGTHAARALLPGVPRTRAGVRRREHVSADDVKLDRMVHVPGYGAVTVVQFGFFDYGMGLYLPTFGQRPVIPRPDGTNEMLARRDFLFSLAMMLEDEGFPLDWTMHLLLENGVAALSKAEQRFLWESSEGQIICHCNSMDGETIAGYEERRKGRSTAKACHEEFHKRLHNASAHFRMQTGKDRDHAPARLLGMERQSLALENVAVQLPPEQRARLLFPAADIETVRRETAQAIAWCNAEQHHEREGFRKLMEWRPRGFEMLARPEAELEAWISQTPFVREALAANPARLHEFIEWFPRMESALERDARHAPEGRWQKFPPGALARFYEDCHELRRVDVVKGIGPCFRFQREGKKYCFVPETPDDEIKEGTQVSGFFRPDAKCIHLFTPADSPRYLVSWVALDGLRLRHDADADTRNEAFKRPARFFSAALKAANKASRPQWETAQAEARNNLDVLQDNAIALTPAEPRKAARGAATRPLRGNAGDAVAGVTHDRAVAKQRAARHEAAARQESGSISDLVMEDSAPAEEAAGEDAGSLSDIL